MALAEKYFDAKIENISEGISFINDNLKKLKVKSKDNIKAQLLAEEFLAKIISSKSEEDSEQIRVAVDKKYGKITTVVSYKGKQIENIDNLGLDLDLSEIGDSADAEASIRNIVIKANDDFYFVSYKNGINKVTINVGDSSKNKLKVLALSLLFAIVAGVILKAFLPENAINFIDSNILQTIKTLFLNAFKLITGPVIFFSIASCISMFTDMKEMGKLAGKVVLFYLFTTAIAIAVAFLVFFVIDPGNFGEMEHLATSKPVEAEEFSVVNTIIGIVPDNIVKAFLELNTLQIMVIGLFVGLGAAKLGEKSAKISDFLSNANDLFLKITSIIAKFIPIMFFVSITSLVLTMDIENIKTIAGAMVSIFLCLLIMVIIYNLIVFLATKTSPKTFMKNTIGAWINAMVLQSSSACMSYNMDVCKKMKISPKLFSFSIPLGATINMDGLTVVLVVSTLFLAKIFGVELESSDYITIIVMAIVLSVACPGVTGAGLVCMSLMLSQFAVPTEALAVFIGYYVISDPFFTANNILGDLAGTYTIAKRNNLMEK